MFLNGAFNVMLGPLIFYEWIWIGTLVLAGMAFILTYFALWAPMKPLSGLFWAQKHYTAASLILNRIGKGEIVPLIESACIIDVERDVELEGRLGMLEDVPETKMEALYRRLTGANRTVRFIEKAEQCPLNQAGHVICNGVDVTLVQDSDNWTIRDSPQHRAIVDSIVVYNELNENDKVLTYGKWAKRVLEGKIPKPDDISLIEVISWKRIDDAFPRDILPGHFGGKVREILNRLKDEQKQFLQRLCVIFLVGGCGLAALIVILRIILKAV